MAGASFTLGLVDKLSAPAKTIGSNLDQLTSKAKGLSTSMGGLETSLGTASTSSFQAAGSFESMGDMATAAAVPMKAIAKAAAVAAAAIIGLTVAGAAYAIAQTEMREKTLATLGALAGTPKAGAAMLSMLDSMRAKLGMTTAELVPMAEQLTAMGVKSADLKTQLTALATVKAIGLDGGTEEYTNILKKLSAQAKISTKDLTGLSKTGVSEAEVATKLGMSQKQLQAALKNGTMDAKAFGAALTGLVTAKGASALAQQANSLTAQWDIAKENFGKLFDGVNAGPFLIQIKALLSLLDQGTGTGQALKAGITGAINGMLAAATAALPYIRTGIELIVNYALRAYIAMRPLIYSFKEWLTTGGGLNTIWTVIKGIGVAIALLAVGATAAAAVFIGPFVLAGAAIAAVGVGLAWLLGKIVGFVPAAISALSGFASAGATMASGFISGLVSGITSGITAAIGAVTNLGSSMLAAAKNLIPGLGGGGGGGGGSGGGGAGPATAKPNAVGGLVQPANGELLASVAPGEHIVPAGAGLEMPGTGAPQAAPAAGGGGASHGDITINVTVGGGGAAGGGGGQQDAQQMGQIIAEQIALVFEKIGLSGGAALA